VSNFKTVSFPKGDDDSLKSMKNRTQLKLLLFSLPPPPLIFYHDHHVYFPLTSYLTELRKRINTTDPAIIAGLTDTKYSAPYPTHSGNMSVNCCGLSLGSLPIGGLTNGSFLHGWAASSERGVVAGERAATPGLLFIG
jgi:hypothetical protein